MNKPIYIFIDESRHFSREVLAKLRVYLEQQQTNVHRANVITTMHLAADTSGQSIWHDAQFGNAERYKSPELYTRGGMPEVLSAPQRQQKAAQERAKSILGSRRGRWS